MKKSTIISIVLIIAAGLIGYGLGINKEGNLTGNGQPTTKEPIKIGFSAPLTGEGGSWGLPIQRGAQIALDKVNNEGGINGSKLELIFEDDKCDGKEGATIANKFINIDKVPAIIGTVCSSVTLAMSPIAEQNKILLLSSGSSAPAVKDAGDYVFTIYPLDNYEAGIAVDFAYDKLGKKAAAIIYSNNDFGLGAKNVIEEKFKQKGGKISIIENYLLGAKDFRTELTKIRDSDADVLFIWGQPNEMIPLLMQIKEMNLPMQIITTSVDIETDNLKQAGTELANGVIYTSFKTVANENLEYLNKKYAELYNKDDGWFPTIGYDVVLLIRDAILNAGLDSTKMKDYLYTVKNFPGASGNMSFDKYGTVIKDFIFKTVKSGQFVPYEE